MGAAFAVAMNSTATMPIAPVLSLWPDSTGTSTNSLPVRSALVIERSPSSLHGPARALLARARWSERRDASNGCVLDHPERDEGRTEGRRRTRSPVDFVCFRFVRDQTIDTIAPKGMHSWLSHCLGARGSDRGDRLRRVLLRG